MILLVDNFDSFTYNIAQSFEQLGERVKIVRPYEPFIDDEVTRVVIGPGPGHPKEATYALEVISHFIGKIPLLGICLGHQCLAISFGAEVTRAKKAIHGKASRITHDQQGLFKQLPTPLSVIRYHSLIVNAVGLPACLEITATTEEGEIMGLRHQEGHFESVQYHPDSVMTERGLDFFNNFLEKI